MNNPSPIETTLALTVQVRSANGSSTEFCQNEEESIRKTLRSLTSPRLFTQPQLVLAGEPGVSAIPCPSIDMIFARTLARTPLIFPLIFPAGLLDLVEGQDDPLAIGSPLHANRTRVATPRLSPLVSRLKIHTTGGWAVTLRALATARDSAQHESQPADQLRTLPIIPFRLLEGGIGLINPKNITGVSVEPACDAWHDSAPMDLFRRNPYRF